MTEAVQVSPIQHTYNVHPDTIYAFVERKDADKLAEYGGVDKLLSELQVDRERGIDSHSTDLRRAQYGRNELDQKPPVTFFEFLAEAFQDKIVLLLCAAAVISIIFGMTLANPHTGEVEREKGWIEGTAICISVVVVTLTGSINNYQKAKKFEELEKEQSIKEVQVVRDGIELTIDSRDIVVGDVMCVEGGVMLSADGMYLDGQDLKCNEAAMTGESDIMEKDAVKDPFFLSGTLLEEGVGHILIVAIGMQSFQGRMKKEISEGGNEETPLQEDLGKLADNIGKFGLIAAVILVVALVIKELIFIFEDDKSANATNFLNFVIIAITLLVVAIPEGLPLAVTISLAFSMKAMMKDNCMVRILASCEVMGAATAVCSDKTGTLTTNVMTTVQGLISGKEFVIANYGVQPRVSAHESPREGLSDHLQSTSIGISADALDKFCFALSINSSAREQVVDGTVMWIGNKTEHGLLGFVKNVKRDYAAMRASVKEADKRQFPFNSKKKRMTTIVRDSTGQMTSYTKGASEVVLEDCDRYVDAEGQVKTLDAPTRDTFNEIILDMATQGNRTIGIAFSPCPIQEFPDEEPHQPMVFMGVMGIQDPIRPEVPPAVLKCNSAGLTVRVVTGDNINTAIAIGKKCNIYHENGFDLAMTGPEFRQMHTEDRERLKTLLPRLRILARSSPQDKYYLVEMLKESDEVVAVTGDGTNDAPALKLADVGFAMNTGTDIAKSAADMVLLDDNFASVVRAIMWGRAVNDNVRKFLQFQLSINVGGVIITIIGSIATKNSSEPLTPVQLLWLNLVMDTLAALALATEMPEERSLERLPIFKQAPLISNNMWSFIIFHSVFQTALMMGVIFDGHNWFNIEEDVTSCHDNGGTMHSTGYCSRGRIHGTIIFNMFIWLQIFNIFNSRKLFREMNPFEGLNRSPALMIVFGILVVFQIIAVEAFGDFMSTTGLRWDYWLICVGLGALELIVGVLQRLIPVEDFIPTSVTERKEYIHQLMLEHHNDHKEGGIHFHKHDASLKRSHSITKHNEGVAAPSN